MFTEQVPSWEIHPSAGEPWPPRARYWLHRNPDGSYTVSGSIDRRSGLALTYLLTWEPEREDTPADKGRTRFYSKATALNALRKFIEGST